jgi:hypothetical protein
MVRLSRRIAAHLSARPTRRRAIVLAAAGVWALILGAWALHAYSTELVDSYAKCADEGYPLSDTDPVTCTAGGHTFLGPRPTAAPATAATEPATGESVPFDILVNGDSGSDYPNRQEVIITDAAWRSYWRDIHAGQKNLPPLLPVDFTKNQVVALSEGQQSTGGYNLKVTSVVTGPRGSVVNVTESIPTVTCKVTQSITNRYFIVRTPVLRTPVSFRITTDHHRCQ